MTRLRLVVHALDRTGPPVLAVALLRWVVTHRPEVEVDVVAFRGGPLLDEVVGLAPVRVLLDPHEPWDDDAPDPVRVEQLRTRLSPDDADVTLLVSISAGSALPVLGGSVGTLVTWVVEQHEPFVDDVVRRTSVWLAGSAGIAQDLTSMLSAGSSIVLAPEFVDTPTVDGADWENRRLALGAGPDDLLVVGAGIATPRKAPDLFVEVAAAVGRRGHDDVAFAWIGGERDEMFHLVREDARRAGVERVRFVESVPDVVPWFAAADVLLHPARFDAFPLVCLHAAAAGTPVVAFSDAGGVPEMFGDAFVGAPYPDVGGLADAVVELAHPERRAAVADAQRRRVVERYTAERCAPVVIGHVLGAVDAPGPPDRAAAPTATGTRAAT